MEEDTVGGNGRVRLAHAGFGALDHPGKGAQEAGEARVYGSGVTKI